MHLRVLRVIIQLVSHARRTSAVVEVPALPKIALHIFINID